MSAKNKGQASKSKSTKEKSAEKPEKKESKGGTSVKVRHILCEKQV